MKVNTKVNKSFEHCCYLMSSFHKNSSESDAASAIAFIQCKCSLICVWACGSSVLRSHLLFTVSFVDHEGRKLRVGVDLGMKVTDAVNLLFFVFLNKFATVKNGQDLVGKSEGSNFWIKM